MASVLVHFLGHGVIVDDQNKLLVVFLPKNSTLKFSTADVDWSVYSTSFLK